MLLHNFGLLDSALNLALRFVRINILLSKHVALPLHHHLTVGNRRLFSLILCILNHFLLD